MHRRKLAPANIFELARKRKKDGFALILALGLMALLLVLLLSLSTLSRMETGINEARSQHQQSRQNALLGLKIALGNLQKLAGPDQRVTARADLLGQGSANPYWTGVWATDVQNREPAWLVSGSNPNPAIPLLGLSGVRLASGAGNGESVFVASVPVIPEKPPDGSSTEPSHQNGHYAYWISDEGVKSSLAKTDRVGELNNNSYGDQFRKRLRQLSAVRPRREVFFPDLEKEEPEVIRENLNKTTSLGQIALLPGVSANELKGSFFDATHLSFGVLCNTAEGELKRDLSASQIQDTGFTLVETLKRAAGRRINEEGFVDFPGQGMPATVNAGDFLNAPSPLTSEFALFVGIFKNSLESDRFRLELGYWSELWNPYSFPMAFDPETENDLVIKVSGLPEIQVNWEANRGQNNNQIGSFSLNLDDFQDEFTINFGIPLAEGEVKTRIARVRHVLDQSLPPGTVNNPAKNFVSLSAPASILTVRFFNASGQLLKEVRNLHFDGFNTSEFGLSRDASPSRTNPKHYQFAFHYKFLDDPFPLAEGQNSDMEKWLSELDFRSVLLDLGDNLLHASLFSLTTDPSALHFEIFFDDTDLFDDGAGNFFRIFDFPAVDPVSMGTLQHLQILGGRPFGIGNPWGGLKNAVFDRFFLSTVPQSEASWKPQERLPNTHLTTHSSPFLPLEVDRLRSQYSSANFLVEGAFNLNSTSVEAWKSVLSGLNLSNWTYRFDDFTFTEPLPPITRPRVKNGFFRLPHGADRQFSHPYEVYSDYPEITPQQKKDWYKRPQQDWKNAYRSGMRELTDKEVDDLAGVIVRLLQDNGVPFVSMEEFVNSGLLQDGIDATTINTVNGANYDFTSSANRIPFNAPSFLTQADILSTIAPFLQTRSDTFLIRTYGDAFNPITGQILGRTWCEALVQRVPTPVDFRDASDLELILEDYVNPPSPFGRQFKVIHFRWLDSSDI